MRIRAEWRFGPRFTLRFSITFGFTFSAFVLALTFAAPFAWRLRVGTIAWQIFVFSMGIGAVRSPGAAALGVKGHTPSFLPCQLFGFRDLVFDAVRRRSGRRLPCTRLEVTWTRFWFWFIGRWICRLRPAQKGIFGFLKLFPADELPT